MFVSQEYCVLRILDNSRLCDSSEKRAEWKIPEVTATVHSHLPLYPEQLLASSSTALIIKIAIT